MSKKLFSIILVICLLFNIFTGINVLAADTSGTINTGEEGIKGTITVSVEKFTLGQGYIIEPIKVPFYEGDNGAKVITDLLTEYLGDGNFNYTGSTESSFYLSSIRDGGPDEANIPDYIVNQMGYADGRANEEWLGEFDYSYMSGWMYAVNNWFPNYGFSDYFPEDGDVVRVQFSVYGYGSDLGAVSEWGMEPLIIAADKDALTAKIAEVNSAPNKVELLSNPKIKTACDNAYEVLKNMESTQDSVDKALKELNKALSSKEQEIKKTIKSIAPIADIRVDFGTTSEEAIVALSETTTIIDSDEKEHEVILSWTIADYDANKAGEYSATATFDLPEGVSQAEPAIELIVTAKVIVSAPSHPTDTIQSAREHLAKSLDYIYRITPNPTFGTVGGEWSILALARGGYEVSEEYYDIYYNNVVKEVNSLMPASGSKPDGRLDRNKGTEHSRLIIGLTAIGKDITDVGGYDIRKALADFTYVTRQGVNGPIFALIAFNSHNYEIPLIDGLTNQSTRDKFVDYILGKEINKDTGNAGGWALSGNNPDPDITAMAIQALTPYYNTRSDVKEAVDRAINWLSKAQQEDGGFASWGSENSESIAQVIVALTEMGIDPHTDPRFVKNGISAVDALLTYTGPEGGFMHVKPGRNTGGGAEAGAIDGMATEQGTYALVAYIRFLDGKSSLYNMTDVVLEGVDPGEPEEPKNPENPKENEIPLPEGDNPKAEIPSDGKDYNLTIKKEDGDRELTIEIPANSSSRVTVALPVNESLPQIEVVKGEVSAIISKGTKVINGDASALELIMPKDKNDASLKEKLDGVIPQGRKLDEIILAFSMGGSSRVEFSDFVTLTFAGMKGKEAAYIQNGSLHIIQKYADDSEGQKSGKAEYSYDDGEALVVKTKHFTDFVIFVAGNTETPGNSGGGAAPAAKKYITLSIDKLTINKGYVIRPTQVEFYDGESVWDVLKRELDKSGISYDYVWTPKYNSIYVQSIDGDGEFDHGSGSGWMYNVNGWYPNYGASLYVLKDGDKINWRYTTNLGADLGEDIAKWEQPAINEDGTKAPSLPVNPTDEGENETSITADIDLNEIYSDLSSISSWAVEAVKRATTMGLVAGYNGKFNSKANITRAEFTKIMVSVLNLDIKADKVITFADVKENQWFYPYVNAAYKAGIIKGSGNRFNPDSNITREEMAAIIVRALGIEPIKTDTTLKDSDKVSDWAKADVETAIAIGLMTGDKGYFDPKAFATREMATVVAMRCFDYRSDNKTEDRTAEKAKHMEVKEYIDATADFMLKTIPDPVVASVGGEWTVFGLARSGVNVPEEYFEKYYANVEKTLKENSGVLHRVKYTEYDRIILALTALGKDVKNVAGYDLTKPLADLNTLIRQGINGPIFALIALDSHNYEIPADNTVKVQTTRQRLIDFILGREIQGGGWALGENPTEADPDITAMAIQSLAPYYEKDERVKAAVDRGLEWLSKVQDEEGGYSSWGSVNSESIAQVIVALTSLGIDPHNDPKFIKNGNSAVDALLSFCAPGGGFYHIKPGGKGNGGADPGEVDAMATDQAMYALVAYDRFIHGQNRLYDMTDVNIKVK